jgi:hypothetical protein
MGCSFCPTIAIIMATLGNLTLVLMAVMIA